MVNIQVVNEPMGLNRQTPRPLIFIHDFIHTAYCKLQQGSLAIQDSISL